MALYMAKNRRQRKKRQYEADRLDQRYNALMTGLALFTLTVAPLIFRMVRLDFVSPAITNTTTADSGAMNDVFTHYKMLIYYTLSIALIMIFAAKLLTTENGGFRLTRYDAALAALCAFLLLSCIVSEYRVIAFNGFVYMLDGTVEHICYCLLFFFGFHVFSKSALKKWFYAPLYVCGLINALIALLNFTGVNMIDNAIVKTVLGVPANAVATNARAFTSTFGNTNYLSGFGGVLFAVFFTKLLFSASPLRLAGKTTQGEPPDRSPGKSAPRANLLERFDRAVLLQNALSLLMVAASFTIVVTSLSSSGFLTFVVMAPIVIAFALLCGATRRKIALAAASLAVCALLLVSLASVNETVFDETFGMFNMLAYGASGEENPGIATDRHAAIAEYSQTAGITLLTLNNNAAPAASADSVRSPALRQLSNYNSGAVPPAVQQFGGVLPTGFDLPQDFPEASVSPGTGRLYIWEETLRLIASKPLTGYGMDTLSYAFPQNHLEKIAGLGSYTIYVTKPHNVYIGYAYGAGIPALLAFMALNVFAAVAFLRWFMSRRATGEAPDMMIMCAFLGWAAYLVQAFVNDDLISTAPLWWTLFGVGAGLLRAATSARNNNVC